MCPSQEVWRLGRLTTLRTLLPDVRMCLEIHLAVADEHTFRAETDLLLESDLVLQQDLATGPDHPVPRQAVARMQRPNDLPRTSRVTGGLRHLTISRDIAARDALYR